MKSRLMFPVIATALTLGLHSGSGLLWGWSALAGFVGLPIILILLTIDDDMSGGWSNPDGKTRPDWQTARFLGYILAGLAVSSAAAILDDNWVSRRGALLGGCALLAGVSAAFLFKRRAA
jgi:hypothetical protein